MDADELYDEFGNYIGPELDDSESEPESAPGPVLEPLQTDESVATPAAVELEIPFRPDSVLGDTNAVAELPDPASAIVLAEDKQYYPSAEDVYGPETEVLVEEEDAQPISEPIIAPNIERSSGLHESAESTPAPRYDLRYFTQAVLSTPALTRNVALLGHLHHGKTSLADMMFAASHHMPWDALSDRQLPVRYTDTRRDEQQLHISLKTTAASMLLPGLSGKSYGITFLDTPGHVNFMDEAIAAMNLVDGAVFVVDVTEGVMLGTELLLQKAAAMRLDIVLVVSKIDRLILELRMPPADAYHKIRHVIDSVNDVIGVLGHRPLSPARGNVAFSASSESICFTLPQFAQSYIEANGGAQELPLENKALAKRLWGDIFYDRERRTFSKTKPSTSTERTFVEFVLEPLFKLHTAIVSYDIEDLTQFLSRNHLLDVGGKRVPLSEHRGFVQREDLHADLKQLLRSVNGQAYGMGSVSGLADMIVNHVRAPDAAAPRKLETMRVPRSNDNDDDHEADWCDAMHECDTSRPAPMTAYVGKLVPDEKGIHFDALVRVLSGQLHTGDQIRVLGDGYDVDLNDEEQASAVVGDLYLPCARFKVQIQQAFAGQLVLVRGIDHTVFKSATIVSANHPACNRAMTLRPLQELLSSGVVKVAVEPVRPSELPKMVDGLRKCVKAFPGLITRVEESGEHTLVAPGELYMDCVLRDLRESYAEIEVKVSDPVVPFSETVAETSALQCYADTPNGQNKITMVAEPLEEDIVDALDSGHFGKRTDVPSELRELGWDALAAKSLWSFGPHTTCGPNALLNDILDPDSRSHASVVRESIVQGFCWATREGPLTDGPVRGVKLRLLDVTVSDSVIGRSPAQVIPASRRVAYSAMLTASPRLMEPMYLVEMTGPQEAVAAVYTLVSRRRGNVISEAPVAGTPLMCVRAHMPVLDSFGFEPDLRNLTHGAAFCLQVFDHWATVPGDPLDKTVELRPLEPAGRRELARECMVKTRRRKGMPDDVSITKYFDDPSLLEFAGDLL